MQLVSNVHPFVFPSFNSMRGPQKDKSCLVRMTETGITCHTPCTRFLSKYAYGTRHLGPRIVSSRFLLLSYPHVAFSVACTCFFKTVAEEAGAA